MLNGWAMLAGGALLLAVSALTEVWEVTWSAQAVGSIAYLAVIGSAVPFVTLTILLRELPAVTMSYITLAAAVRRARLRRRALRRARDAARRRRRRAGRLRAARRPVALRRRRAAVRPA